MIGIWLGKTWHRILWRFRDPEMDGYDMRDVRLENGIIYREKLCGSERSGTTKPAEAHTLVHAELEDGSLVIRLPKAFLDANHIAIRPGDYLIASRASSRSMLIETR